MSGKAQPVREPPGELKSVKNFILRGNQLRTADPIITYYCFFWAIKHILANSLHSATPECIAWTTDLMDELERRKAALGNNELISDDMAAQAYVENFALRIFNNGATVVEKGNATNQTSDTLLAGATLLEVCKVFGDLDAETLQKIKYAKFHAARIWKATSAGEDPNPPKPSPAETSATAEEIEDPRGPPPDIYGNQNELSSHAPLQPSIEEVPDESVELEPKLARTGIYDESLHPSRQSPAPQQQETETEMEVNMIDDILPSPPRSPKVSEYFPPTPAPPPPPPPQIIYQQSAPAPSLFAMGGNTNTNTNTPFPHNPNNPNTMYHPDPFQSPYNHPAPPPPVGHQNPGGDFNPFLPQQPTPSYQQHSQRAQYAPPPPPPPPPPVQKPKKEVTTEDMAKAQKHARWAVSALDYEDVETAVKQFRMGLQVLGVED